jgi:PAS domain S-box-containing protein
MSSRRYSRPLFVAFCACAMGDAAHAVDAIPPPQPVSLWPLITIAALGAALVLYTIVGYVRARQIAIHEDEIERIVVERAAQLRDRSRQLATLMNASADPVLFKDADGRWIEANEGLLSLTGLVDVDYRGKTDRQIAGLSFFLAAGGDRLVSSEASRWRFGRTRSEERFTLPNGRPRVYDVVKEPILDDRKEPVGMVMVARDVTDRKNDEEALSRFKTTLDRVREMVIFFHPTDLKIFYANQGAADLLGVAAERIVGATPTRFFPEFDIPALQSFVSRMARGAEGLKTFETLVTRSDGRPAPVEATLQYVAAGPNEGRMVISARDITARRRAEDALRLVIGEAATATGANFFRALTRALVNALGLTGAAVAEIGGPEKRTARLLAGNVGGRELPDWEGDPGGLPGWNERKKIFERITVGDDASSLFAADPLVSASGGPGVRSIPLFDTDGRVTGLLWVTGAAAEVDDALHDYILRIFAARAGSELERIRTVRAMQESERNFKSLYEWRERILEHSPEGIIHLDGEMRIVFMSPAMRTITGAPPDDTRLLNQRITDLPSIKAVGAERWLDRLVDGESVAFETPFTSFYGRTAYLSIKGVPIMEGNRFSGGVVLVADITESRRASEALKQSEELLARAQRLAHVGSYDWDLPTDTAVWSDELYRIMGYEPGAFPAGTLPFVDAIHPDDRIRLDAVVTDALANRRDRVEGAYRIVRPDGDVRYVHALAELIYSDGAQLVRVVGSIHDVTDLRHVEESLARAQSIAHIGSWDWNIATGALVWSDEIYRIFGLAPQEFAATYETFLERVHPEDRQPVDDATRIALEENKPYRITHRVVRPDGEERVVEERAEVFRDDKGKPIRMIGAVHDVTEQHKTQEALRRAQKLESLGLLAGGVAHDFNNILVGIIGNANLALDDLHEESTARESVERALASARRAAELANQMLAYSGKGRFHTRPFDFNELIRDLDLFLVAGMAKNVVVTYHLSDALPPVSGDETQVRQIVMNLILNAADALKETGDGTITVTTEPATVTRRPAGRFADAPPTPGVYALLTVVDNGCGMDEATIAKIFDPFFTTKFTGRGLGLAATLGIIRGHHGSVSVTSEPGAGTTFKVWLPASTEAASPKEAPPAPLPADTIMGEGVALIVDDEETVRHVAGRILKRAGFAVETAVDGIDGLEKFSREPGRYALLVIDMTMPRMDGQTLFRHIRAIDKDVPALISSGYDEQMTADGFSDAKRFGFIQKPYTKQEFLQAVNRLLNENGD